MIRKLIIAMLMAFPLSPALISAYSIKPSEDLHEYFARAAKACFDRALAENTKPQDCRTDYADFDDVDTTWIEDSSLSMFDISGRIQRWRGITASYPTLEDAVQWPDDPTRQIGLFGIVEFAFSMLTDCDNLLEEQGASNTINEGLLCNSHFGEMQFFHAQASRVGEPGVDTHAKIMAWAGFLFDVASGAISDSELDRNYCDYFTGDSLFDRSMLPSQNAMPCGGENNPAWKLTTLFTLKCNDPFSSDGCDEANDASRHNKSRIQATGALMHLIQDSYSQSHCVRGECVVENDSVLAKIECLPITRFTTYRGQVNHPEADALPLVMSSCDSDADVDHPITASAKVLWHIDQQSDKDEFISDLEFVFGSREWAEQNIRPADLGECFTAEYGD